MIEYIESSVREAAKLMLMASDEKGIEEKSSAKDLVTKYDKMVQEKLYEALSKKFPSSGFLGEEGLKSAGNGGGVFIIDPIDGTTNFIKGLNHSAVSVGYYLDGSMKYGVVYNPYADEMFTAEKGKGAFLNGKRIKVSSNPIEKSVAHYGTAPYSKELSRKSFDLAFELTKRVIDSRRFGAATLDFCDLACGRVEIFFEYLLCPWDIAAGSLIAEEAGAIVTDMNGEKLQFEGKTSLLAATKECYPIVLDIVRKNEKKE